MQTPRFDYSLAVKLFHRDTHQRKEYFTAVTFVNNVILIKKKNQGGTSDYFLSVLFTFL